jgi:hypothetical protein
LDLFKVAVVHCGRGKYTLIENVVKILLKSC